MIRNIQALDELNTLASQAAGGPTPDADASLRQIQVALLKALDTLEKDPQSPPPVDRNLLAGYGMADPGELRRALADRKRLEHARLKQGLRTQSEEELKSRFAETIVGMKTKETQGSDRTTAWRWIRCPTSTTWAAGSPAPTAC